MRGYFGIGVERVSKAMNLGSLLRTAHAFGASFTFAIAPALKDMSFQAREVGRADTSDAPGHVPFYQVASVAELALPRGCKLIGVELLDEARDLPSFHHPLQAAYVLGPERGSLSPVLIERCDGLIRIPTQFCVNLAVAGAIVMYDRMLTHGRFAERPLASAARPHPRGAHVHGDPIWKRKALRRAREG
jgi:tRNA G18 (ribose-2'-O)-methylase SpoU